VLCEEKYEFLHKLWPTNFSLQSRNTLQPLASCLTTKRFGFDSWASPCDLCGGQSVIGTDNSPNIPVFLFQYYSTFFSYSLSSL
jgi:hypothetical protein